MTARTINVITGEETERPLTQAELDEASVRTAEELAQTLVPNPDDDLQSDIAASTDLESLKAALLGNGPNSARVRGRK